MKNLFPQFYRKTDDEFSALFATAIFIVDANMLLHLYRYPKSASTDLLKILHYLASENRLFVPFQVALEFQANRLKVISSQRGKYGEIKKVINDIQTDLKAKLDGLHLRKRHSSIDPDVLLTEISASFSKYLQTLNKHEEAQLDVYDQDSVRSDLDTLLQGRIGKPFTQIELNGIFEEGTKRYKLGRPPGFKDEAEKKNTYIFHDDLIIKREFGDLIVWKEIIRYIKENNPTGIIFVTDDNKEDWWAELSGKTIGPQPALLSEIKTETGLTDFYIYNAERFMDYSSINFNLSIEKESIEQAKRVSRERTPLSGKHARFTTLRTILSSIYSNECQICDHTDTEVALIVPTTFGGSASIGNSLLLCATHHKLFDTGKFTIEDNMNLKGISGTLKVAPEHPISTLALDFHNKNVFVYSTNPTQDV